MPNFACSSGVSDVLLRCATLVPNCCVAFVGISMDETCAQEILYAIERTELAIYEVSKKQIAHACRAKHETNGHALKWGIEYDSDAEFNVDDTVCASLKEEQFL